MIQNTSIYQSYITSLTSVSIRLWTQTLFYFYKSTELKQCMGTLWVGLIKRWARTAVSAVSYWTGKL